MTAHKIPEVFIICAALAAAAFADIPPSVQDFTGVTLAELKLAPVAEAKDPRTGFLVGGKNSSDSILRLTELNGRPIADLEVEMRPGQASAKGFLGADEKLLAVLAADNRLVVDEHRLTHQELAHHLRVLAAIGLKQPDREFLYHGSRFSVSFRHFRGWQASPFHDGTRSSSEAIINNITNGQRLEYSLLVPEMIERYGFYEGTGTPYRVAPERILAVLDLLDPDRCGN